MAVPEETVQRALEAARAAMYRVDGSSHRVPGISLEGALRAALEAVWPAGEKGSEGAS